MGTYRQPSLVLDKSFGQINEAMAEFNSNLIAKINAEKKQALANEKAKNKLLREQEKANASYRKYGREIEAKLSTLKPYFEDDVISVNTGVGAVQKSVEEFEIDLANYNSGTSSADLGYGDNFNLQEYFENTLDSNLEDETGGASFELKSEIRVLYTALKDYRQGSDEYERIKDGIEARLSQAPVLFNLLNTTSSKAAKGYTWDGKMKEEKAGINNIILRDGRPQWDLRAEMSKNISQKTNQGRFHFEFDEKTMMSSITYEGKDGDTYKVPFDTLKNNITLGTNGLLDMSNNEPFNKMVDTYFDPFFKNEYKNAIKEQKTTTSTLQGNTRNRVVENITNTESANNLLWDRVNNWVDSGGLSSGEIPWYSQNNWQLLGGKGTFDPNNGEQLEEAKQMLYDKLLKEKGQETTFEKDFSSTELKDGYGAATTNRLTKGIKLTDKSNQYITQNQKDPDDQTGRAEYGYQDLWNNFKSLTSKSGNKGVTSLLTDIASKSGYAYETGEEVAAQYKDQMNKEIVQLKSQGASDSEIKEVKQAYEDIYKAYEQNPTDTYKTYKKDTEAFKSVKAMDLSDWETFLNELQWKTGATSKSHERAVNAIDTDIEMASNRQPLPGMTTTT